MADDNKNSTQQSNTRKTPTDKMLSAAHRAAARHKLELPAEVATSFEACRAFLDKWINRPSEKQLSFAREVSASAGIGLPGELLNDAKGLSAWIDQHKED